MPDRPATRAALLELREDRRVVDEGYRFLDEKRIALAQELLRQLAQFQEQSRTLAAAQTDGQAALATAVERHGLEGLQVQPMNERSIAALRQRLSAFLGLDLIAELAVQEGPSIEAGRIGSPEGEHCGEAFQRLAESAAQLGARVANLLRLADEYRRTERRVRALEKIVRPELQQEQRRIEEALDQLEQEELIRARRFAGQNGAKDSVPGMAGGRQTKGAG